MRFYALLFFSLLLQSHLLIAQGNNFEWAKLVGGTSSDTPEDMVTDDNGNTYVIGNFSSTSTSFGNNVSLTGSGNVIDLDVFVAKFDPSGNAVWALGFQGNGEDEGYGIDMDGSGNLYVVGTYKGSLNIENETFTTSTANGEDIFIAKVSPSGSVLWAKRVYGNSSLFGYDIAVHDNGDFYICGKILGNVTAGDFPYSNVGNNSNAFLAKYDASGNLLWFEQIHGTSGGGQSSLQDADRVAVSPDGKCVYLAGWFLGTVTWDGPQPAGVTLTDQGGDKNFFIASYDSTGTVKWVNQVEAFQVNNSVWGNIYDLETQSNGNVIVAGKYGGGITFNQTVTFEIDPTFNPSSWHYEGFLAAYDSMGTYLFAENIISEENGVAAIAIDSRDYILITGISDGPTDFGSGISATVPTGAPFIATYDLTGTINSVITVSAGNFTSASGIDTDGNDDIYACGDFLGTLTLDPHQLIALGFRNGYVTKVGEGTFVREKNINPDVKLYPNPSNNRITIEYNGLGKLTEVIVTDGMGKRILTSVPDGDNNQLTIDGLASGAYRIVIYSSEGFAVKSLIIAE